MVEVDGGGGGWCGWWQMGWRWRGRERRRMEKGEGTGEEEEEEEEGTGGVESRTFAPARLSVEIPVLQVSVLERETFLPPLGPLLIVKVDVSAL